MTSTQLTGGQWIGPMVRTQNGGQNAYVGIYFWNNGSPELQLFKRSGGNSWTQLGSTYNSGPLAAGTQLKVTAVGSTISFLQNGVTRISVTDTSLTGGAPGIMSYGTGQVDNWSGGAASGADVLRSAGRVSGLSGTVVLQDNGGDNLSVSANGVVHVRDRAGRRGGVRGDGEDQPGRADLHGRERLGDGRLGQRDQRGGHLRAAAPPTRSAGLCRGCRGRWCCRTTAVTT